MSPEWTWDRRRGQNEMRTARHPMMDTPIHKYSRSLVLRAEQTGGQVDEYNLDLLPISVEQ